MSLASQFLPCNHKNTVKKEYERRWKKTTCAPGCKWTLDSQREHPEQIRRCLEQVKSVHCQELFQYECVSTRECCSLNYCIVRDPADLLPSNGGHRHTVTLCRVHAATQGRHFFTVQVMGHCFSAVCLPCMCGRNLWCREDRSSKDSWVNIAVLCHECDTFIC